MSNTNETKQQKDSVYNLYKSMDLSEEMDSDKLALNWLANHGKTFYGFVDGHWLSKEEIEKDIKADVECHKICDYFSGKHFCDVYTSVDKSLLDWAVKKSLNTPVGCTKWADINVVTKSKILLNIANAIEKQQELFAVVESLSSGKHLHKVKTRDIPNLIESLKFSAGCVLKLNDEWFPSGTVCVITEEYNNPSLNLSLRVSSLLASANSVILLTDPSSSMFAFLLAEICSNAGLPVGVLNVIPIDKDKLKTQDLPSFSKLIFTGSYENSILYSKLSAKACIPFEVLIPKRPVVIVYERADLHSAANGVLEAFFYHDTRAKSGGCKVMVQESIEQKFIKILSERFLNLLVGSNLSKTDLSCIVSEEQKKILTECIEEAVKMKAKLFTPSNLKSENCNYINMLPTLITDVETSPKLLYEELGGPIIVTTPFRTIKESIAMFNCDNKGSPVSIWTEIISVALEVAGKLKSGVVWVNSQNVYDPRIPFTGVHLSGNSVEGGKDAILSHMSMEMSYYVDQKMLTSSNQLENKLSSYATESDVECAISKAACAQPKWEGITDSQKRRILLDIKDKLMKKREEFITELAKVCKSSSDVCGKEVEETLDILYSWAMENDKYCEPLKEIEKNLLVLQSRNPLGVIGIQCPDMKPLLSFVSLVIPAIFYGNAVVALASRNYPTLALKMCEIFTAAKVPVGVINVVSGDPSCLIHPLRKNSAVNAVWYTDVPSENIYLHSNASQKLYKSCMRFWNTITEAESMKYALESTYDKSIYIPSGDIFAN